MERDARCEIAIAGNDLLQEFENQGGPATKLGIFLRRYVLPGIATVAQASGVSTTGRTPPPAPPESITVTPLGAEHVQVVINHTSPVIQGAKHFLHVSANDPSFIDSMIHETGASRAPLPIFLPTKSSTGVTHKYYFGAIIQYPGGPPSKPTYYGGGAPIAVSMTGTTEADIMPGTGSGTASNGGQTFVGLGKAPIRH